MSFRLVIDGNAVYEIDEDCEKCEIKECRCGRKAGPGDGGCSDVGKKTRENRTNR